MTGKTMKIQPRLMVSISLAMLVAINCDGNNSNEDIDTDPGSGGDIHSDTNADSDSDSDGHLNGAILSSGDGVTVLKIWGTHAERGFAMGYLMADNIEILLDNYIRPHFGSSYSAAREIISNEEHFSVPPEYVVEAKQAALGMVAAGSAVDGVDEWDLILINSFLDVSDMVPGLKGSDTTGCSSLISWGDATTGTDLDGKSVATRHLDWGAYDGIVGNNLIVISIPSEADEQPWLAIGYGGFMSALSGINASGVGAFAHVLIDQTHGVGSQGNAYTPVWYLMRAGLEKSDFNGDGADDALDIRDALLSSPNGTGEGFITSAIAPSTSAGDERTALVAELAPGVPHHTFRSNSFEDNIPGDNVYTANHEIGRLDHRNYCSRYNSVISAIDSGAGLGVVESWNLMRDHSNCSALGWDNLQFMQFVPENHLLRLSVYDATPTQAYQNSAHQYDLEELFAQQARDHSTAIAPSSLCPPAGRWPKRPPL